MFDKTHYTNGQPVFLFEGDTLRYFYKNGQLKAEGAYRNDQMEGQWLFYRETGQLWQIGHFLHNQKHGLWLRYDRHNQPEYQEHFHEGKLQKKPSTPSV